MERRSPPESQNPNGCFSSTYDDFYKRGICVSINENALIKSAVEKSSDFSRSGSNSVRFMLMPSDLNDWPPEREGQSDVSPTHRAELSDSNSNIWEHLPEAGAETWYGQSVYFPESFVIDLENDPDPYKDVGLSFLFTQFQNGQEGSPTLSLHVKGDSIQLVRATGSVSGGLPSPSRTNVAKIEKGTWHDFVWRIIWGKGNSGLYQLWHNGSIVAEEFNTQTIYDDRTEGSRLKFGIYYWRWLRKEEVQKSIELGRNEVEVYFDELRYYKGSTNGYAKVVPR